MLDDGADNLVHRAAAALAAEARVGKGVRITLDKRLPVASGIGGGSADAAATLRLLTSLWGLDPALAQRIAPSLGSDVPACLLSMTARGEGAGDALTLVDAGVSGRPVLLVNPRLPLSTAAVFAGWDGVDRGALDDWRQGRNDLEASARAVVPTIGDLLDWMRGCEGVDVARMSGSGATCFALFDSEEARDKAATACPADWWHLASILR
jgi:4-diphosphocytidyl-2-C-methyl-D-erythritol kinase